MWPLIDANVSDQLAKLYLCDSLNTTMCGGDISPDSVSGAKPQPPKVFLDIIGAYVSAGWGKVAVIFSCHTPKKWGYGTPSPKIGVSVPPYPPMQVMLRVTVVWCVCSAVVHPRTTRDRFHGDITRNADRVFADSRCNIIHFNFYRSIISK